MVLKAFLAKKSMLFSTMTLLVSPSYSLEELTLATTVPEHLSSREHILPSSSTTEVQVSSTISDAPLQ